MASYYLDNQIPIWRTPSGSQSITIDPTNENITIENTSIPKKIIISPNELSNGTQVLPYTQLYESINAVSAAVYPPPSSTTMQINNKLEFNDTTNPAYLSIEAYNGIISVDQPIGVPPSYKTQLGAGYIQVVDLPPSGTAFINTMASDQFSMSDGAGAAASYQAVGMRLVNTSSGNDFWVKRTETIANGNDYYFNATTPQMYKVNNAGFGYKITAANPGYTVLKTDSFVFCDAGISNIIVDPPSSYLYDDGSDGYTVYISTYDPSGLDVDLSGTNYYSHSTLNGSGIFHLNKYATATFTLINSTSSGYLWAITMY